MGRFRKKHTASRADLHQPAGGVPATQRRARRAAAARAAVVAGACTAVVAACGAVSSDGTDPDTAPPPTTSAPFLEVGLASEAKLAASLPDTGRGNHIVVIRINLHGRVPQHADPNGDPVSAATDNLLGFQLRWTKTSYDGYGPSGTCAPDAKLVDVDTSFLMTNYYERAGTYKIIFVTGACDPVGTVTKTLTVTAP
jgi:hypothetical protein